MKFVDEVSIEVKAGDGGNGCLSFRREKFVPRGGPNGGDGGQGGNIYLIVDQGLNTLVNFNHKRSFHAGNGQNGMGKKRNGKDGEDLYIKVPPGTLVRDANTNEVIDDLIAADTTLLVAKGGVHGLGNVHFKSSTNRAPRQTTQGELGEKRTLSLEMQILADVGLLGLPNAGKSTFIRAVSAAKPKVANYPFTTLHPHLGVVQTAVGKSFVLADIPGLVQGAASGNGLGIQFLKHLCRARMLLHVVDITGEGSIDRIVKDIWIVEQELKAFGRKLEYKPRWLVANKTDLLSVDKANTYCRQLQHKLAIDSIYPISGLTGAGCKILLEDILARLGTANE